MKINGLKVVDPLTRITLHITAADVKAGDTKDPGACAAARCILREVKGSVAARVHLGRTYIKTKDKWLRFITPEPLRGEIIAFDRGGKFEPGTYTLRPMPPSNRNGKKTWKSSNVGRQKPKHLQKPRAKPHTVTGVRQHGANR